MNARHGARWGALLGLLLALAAGCRSEAEGGKKYRIAVIPKGTTHAFWRSVHAGAEKAAAEAGNVEILWKGPVQEMDTAGQIAVVKNMITQQVDGIVLAPNHSESLVDAVNEANDADIPVVIFDSGLGQGAKTVSYVATDNYNGGVLAARELAKALDGKGAVIMLRYRAGSESTEQREAGFLDTLQKEFPQIKVLSSDQHGETTHSSAQEKSLQLFTRFRDDVTGAFTVCEPYGNGMLEALEQSGLAGKVKFIGFDSSDLLINGMRQGKVHGIVLQDPVQMGYLAVKSMIAHLENKPVEARISTGEYVATPANMDDPKIHALLAPEQF